MVTRDNSVNIQLMERSCLRTRNSLSDFVIVFSTLEIRFRMKNAFIIQIIHILSCIYLSFLTCIFYIFQFFNLLKFRVWTCNNRNKKNCNINQNEWLNKRHKMKLACEGRSRAGHFSRKQRLALSLRHWLDHIS